MLNSFLWRARVPGMMTLGWVGLVPPFSRDASALFIPIRHNACSSESISQKLLHTRSIANCKLSDHTHFLNITQNPWWEPFVQHIARDKRGDSLTPGNTAAPSDCFCRFAHRSVRKAGRVFQ